MNRANAIEEKRRLDLGRVTHPRRLCPCVGFVLQKSSGRLRVQKKRTIGGVRVESSGVSVG